MPSIVPALPAAASRRPRRGTAAAAAATLWATLGLLAAAPASAQVLNVSALVTGTAQSLPLIPFGAMSQNCGAACQYAVVSSAGATTSYTQTPGPYDAQAWPVAFGSNLVGPGSVSETLDVPAAPAGVEQDGGSIGVARRAAVQYAWQPVLAGSRQMQVQTWKDGAGATTVSITIRITPSTTKAHYLRFRVPKATHSRQEAYYVGGPSGYQPITTMPKQVQARSMVDVYADGLPVWSGTRHMLKPQRWSLGYVAYLDLQWGPPLDEDEVTLYLGNLSAGVTRSVSLVFRSDLRTNADTCHTDTEYGVQTQRCDSRREALSLPSVLVNSGGALVFTGYVPDVRVYTY
jgi:hypothetical protein